MEAVLAYAWKAATVWFVAFVPIFELYIAVPTGIALGLDPVSAVIWTVAGNWPPALLVHWGYERLRQVGRVGRWFEQLATGRWRRSLEAGGPLWILLLTPLAGIWAMAVTAKVAGLRARMFLLWSFVSVFGFSVVTAALVVAGVELVSG